jgi:hypothetical protein
MILISLRERGIMSRKSAPFSIAHTGEPIFTSTLRTGRFRYRIVDIIKVHDDSLSNMIARCPRDIVLFRQKKKQPTNFRKMNHILKSPS